MVALFQGNSLLQTLLQLLATDLGATSEEIKEAWAKFFQSFLRSRLSHTCPHWFWRLGLLSNLPPVDFLCQVGMNRHQFANVSLPLLNRRGRLLDHLKFLSLFVPPLRFPIRCTRCSND